MTKVNFYDSIDDSMLKFAVINKNIMENGYSVSRERSTWEVPGGHREQGEDILKQQRENCMRKQEPLINFEIKSDMYLFCDGARQLWERNLWKVIFADTYV